MSAEIPTGDTPVPCWRARAHLRGGTWSDAAYGFGGPDVAELVAGPQALGVELGRFLDSLEWAHVVAERLTSGHFSVLLEVEPHEGPCPPTSPAQDLPAEEPVPRWQVSASVGNGHGIFDAAYSYGNSHGDEGHLVGSAHEVGAELARVLEGLTHADVETMKYGTSRFVLELVIELPEHS